MILIQEVAPKRYNLCGQRRTLESWNEKISGIGSEVKVQVDAGIGRLKSRGRRTSKSRSHWDKDKRIGEYVCSVSIQFNSEGVLNVRKSCISRKWSFWRDYWFYLVRTNAMVESIKKGKGRRHFYDRLRSRKYS